MLTLKNVYITSDQHFFHARSLEILPQRMVDLKVTTVEEMNQELIKIYNFNITNPKSLIIFLGDAVMGKKFDNVPKVIPKLNGIKMLLRGNHDAGFQDTRPGKEEAYIKLYRDNGFELVMDGVVSLNQLLDDCGVAEELPYQINICHFPYKGTSDHKDLEDTYESRYKHLMPDASDILLLHGHNHAKELYTGPNMIHVGVDCEKWKYAPANLLDILKAHNTRTNNG